MVPQGKELMVANCFSKDANTDDKVICSRCIIIKCFNILLPKVMAFASLLYYFFIFCSL